MIINSAKYGMKLWALQLVPALFPFMILTSLFLWFQDKYSQNQHNSFLSSLLGKLWNLSPNGIYILTLGHICGYPSAAKMIADLFKEEKMTKKEASYLLTISNQSSPAFIQSYLITYALDCPDLTIPLFLLIYTSTFLTSLITRFFYPADTVQSSSAIRPAKRSESFFTVLDNSIIKSAATCIQIGGYIILFSVCIAVVQLIFKPFYPLNQLFAASLELTCGLSILKEYPLQTSIRNLVILGCFGFGGFCTMAQIKGMLIGTSLSLKPYVLGKCIYTVILLILAVLII